MLRAYSLEVIWSEGSRTYVSRYGTYNAYTYTIFMPNIHLNALLQKKGLTLETADGTKGKITGIGVYIFVLICVWVHTGVC